MQFTSVLLALSAAAGVFASNAFSTPIGNETLYAGSTFVVRWNNTDGGSTVDLLLKQGKADDLKTALTISTGLSNVGAVRWFLPEDLITGSDYALSITNKDTGDINYSPFFTIIGQNKTTTSSSSSAPRSSSASSTTESSSEATSAPSSGNTTVSTGFTNSTATRSSTKTSGTGSASATKSSSTGTATGSGSPSTNGASFVSYSSLMLAAGIAGAAFMAM